MPAAANVPQGAFERAVAHFQAGRLADALAALEETLAAQPHRGEAMELMGGTLSRMGRVAEALAWYDRAKPLRPQSPSLRHNRALALTALGRLDEALAELREAVRLKPDLHAAWNQMGGVLAALGETGAAANAYRKALSLHETPEAHYNLALLQQSTGQAEAAVESYRRALQLRPGSAAAHNNLANALVTLGRREEALSHYAEALRLDPMLADACSNFGTALREAGRIDEAMPLLERAVSLKPGLAAAHNNLGIAYFARNRLADAARCHETALRLDPSMHEARNNLGNAYAALGREAEAIACYRDVIAAVPEHADAHSNLGLMLQEQGAVADAIACYERALALRADHADAMNNLGYLLQEEGRWDDAVALYRRAIAANPQNARAAYNLGLVFLCRFQFEDGWRLSELRYRTTPPVTVPRPFAIPRFTEADRGAGRLTAIWREQGIGDQLLYSTLLPEWAASGERFVLEVDRRVVQAFQRSYPDWEVVSPEESDAAFGKCERHAAVGSLAALLRKDRADFARQPRALLRPDEARVEQALRALGGERKKIGISWRSFQPAARRYLQRKKSAPLAAFAPLADRADVLLVDLQYGDTTEERQAFAAAGHRLLRIEALDLFNDIEGILAAVAACDLVVTTSNVTAHFAGVLGKPALLMYLRGNPPFHYWVADEKGYSLWYPSVRIVTGRDLLDWPQVMERVIELLDA